MKKSDQKIFGVLFFSLFATIIGVGIVVPLLPVYAHDLGASGLYIGAIFGAFSISRTMLLPYFGRMSDKKGRKPFIVFGLFAYAVVAFAFLLSKNVESLILIRFIQGAASAMIMPVVQAYVGDITPKGKEGFYMGLFNISVFLGLGVGPLMGGVINDRFSLQAAFICMGILAIIGFLLAAILLPPSRSEQIARIEFEPPAWRTLLLDREIAGFFAFRLAYTSCISVIWGFLPVFAAAEFSMDSSSIGILLMVGIVVSGAIQTPMGWLADRIDKRAMVMTGGLIVCCAVYSFVWAGGF
ncbi:MAG: MFS transporter, partial [Desulfobacterales bacterium]|nr:MFS transporter [Desulfobacterales bacterium]